MPVATCVLCGFGAALPDPQGIAADWSEAAACEPGLMTVNFVAARQDGARYRVLAELALPALWPGERRAELAEALAAVLARRLAVPPAEVMVMVRPLDSGAVIENGKRVTW